jgi:hypothetical protein
MTRIHTTPEVKDKAGVLLANDILVKSPNGRMFLKKEKIYDEKFIQAVIKKDVEIVGGTTPKVWKESAKGTLGENGKTYEEIEITKLTDKDKYQEKITPKSVKEV